LKISTALRDNKLKSNFGEEFPRKAATDKNDVDMGVNIKMELVRRLTDFERW
jgi:hypothetical protein